MKIEERGWFKALFRKPIVYAKPFPSDERMKKLMDDTQMRNNPMYQEDCAFTWLQGELDELGITHAQFCDWVKAQ